MTNPNPPYRQLQEVLRALADAMEPRRELPIQPLRELSLPNLERYGMPEVDPLFSSLPPELRPIMADQLAALRVENEDHIRRLQESLGLTDAELEAMNDDRTD